MNNRQQGFAIVEALVVVVILGVIGFVGFRVLGTHKDDTSRSTSQTAKQAKTVSVKWTYDERQQKYVHTGTAPKCREPLKFDNSPIDLAQVTSVMFPGQYRGNNYKAHGGFRLDNSQTGQIEVRLPMDAKLVGLTRYIEGNDNAFQYILTFENDCGIAYRFDHLATLTPDFQQIAETTPAPKKDDTRSNPGDAPKPVFFKAGTVVATAIGHPVTKNFGFDFGVYDYRQRNEISKNTTWAALHSQYAAQDWFGVCWFDMLPGADAAKAKELSEVWVNTSKPKHLISDYCSNATYKTLDFNGGKPTD